MRLNRMHGADSWNSPTESILRTRALEMSSSFAQGDDGYSCYGIYTAPRLAAVSPRKEDFIRLLCGVIKIISENFRAFDVY